MDLSDNPQVLLETLVHDKILLATFNLFVNDWIIVSSLNNRKKRISFVLHRTWDHSILLLQDEGQEPANLLVSLKHFIRYLSSFIIILYTLHLKNWQSSSLLQSFLHLLKETLLCLSMVLVWLGYSPFRPEHNID